MMAASSRRRSQVVDGPGLSAGIRLLAAGMTGGAGWRAEACGRAGRTSLDWTVCSASFIRSLVHAQGDGEVRQFFTGLFAGTGGLGRLFGDPACEPGLMSGAAA